MMKMRMDNQLMVLATMMAVLAAEASVFDLDPHTAVTPAGTQQYCDGEQFVASCAQNQVIAMTSATYGRMRVGKCIKMEREMGCQVSVLSLFDLWCSGRRNCDVTVSFIYDSLGDNNPCEADFRSYLEASFTCITVVTRPQEECIGSSQADVTQPSGYLASLVTDETTCGSLDCPWHLRMRSGQRIKITMFDFATGSRKASNFVGDIPNVCHVYIVIKEDTVKSSETICASNVRESIVYTSVTNAIEVRIVGRKKDREQNGHFILKYEVEGCADPAPPLHGYVERQEWSHSATLRCNSTTEAWTLTCDGTRWVGQRGNCSRGSVPGSVDTIHVGIFNHSQWAAIVLILAIAVVLGLAIFMVGLVYLRRKRSLQDRRRDASRDRQAIPDYYTAQYRDNLSPYGPKPLNAMDGSVSSENDYYRTWQLQRHPPGGRAVLSPPLFAHGYSASNASSSGVFSGYPSVSQYNAVDTNGRGRNVEHIYESPKFERRDIVEDSGSETHSAEGYNAHAQQQRAAIHAPRQYYELDPDGLHHPVIASG